MFGGYTKFIPYYIYSILKSYPDYYVKVFTNTDLSSGEKTCLEMIEKNLSKNFRVYERFIKTPFNTKQVGKMLRFLIPYNQYKDFENVYIGDVDFLIVKEKPSLLDAHLDHCSKIKLPYSNQIRPDSNRLTGLHFFKTQPYYKKMNAIINFYWDNPDKLQNKIEKLKGNEQFLYDMIKHIGFGKLRTYHYRPHHGFHLGVIRNGPSRFKDYVLNGTTHKFHQLPEYQTLKKQLSAYYNDPLFKNMINVHPIKEILLLEKQLQMY